MAVMAPEAGAAAGAAAGAVPGMPGGGEKNRGALLALGIVLLWLAGVAFFFAFEGVKFAESADTSGGGMLAALIGGLSGRAQQRIAQQEKQRDRGE